jgi:hypothetical protein
VLLCADAVAASADLEGGLLACPSCGTGRLRRWGHGRERAIRLLNGKTARLRPRRARCACCDATWPNLRRELDRIAVGTFTGPAGTFRQRTETSPAQLDILARLGIDPPPKIYQLTPAGPLTSANTPPRYTPSS